MYIYVYIYTYTYILTLLKSLRDRDAFGRASHVARTNGRGCSGPREKYPNRKSLLRRGPAEPINIRIPQTMVSCIPIILGLRTRMSDPYVYVLFILGLRTRMSDPYVYVLFILGLRTRMSDPYVYVLFILGLRTRMSDPYVYVVFWASAPCSLIMNTPTP